MLEENKIVTEESAEDRLWTTQEMAAYLGVKEGTLKDWTKLKQNPCPCYRYKSRMLRFEKAEVKEWFKNQSTKWKEPIDKDTSA